jgi:hypothetical protein
MATNEESSQRQISSTVIDVSKESTAVKQAPDLVEPQDSPQSITAFTQVFPASESSPADVPVELQVRVNHEFERLFGISQREVRDMWRNDASRATRRVFSEESIEFLCDSLCEALIGGRSEYCTYNTASNRWGGKTRCCLHCRFLLDERGIFQSASFVWVRLPESTP